MKKIALICNYRLMPERVGGMDYFFWEFDAKCKTNDIAVDWFFPNKSSHGNYSTMKIYSPENQSLENYFLENFSTENYTHIITHFVEICTPFFKKIKKSIQAKVIAVDHNARPIHGYPLKKKINKKLKGFLFSGYIDTFVGVSQYSVNMLVKDFGNHISNKTKIIYNGIDVLQIIAKETFKKSIPKFIVVSHLTENKGIQDLVLAVSILNEIDKSKFNVVVFGEGNYKKELEKMVSKLNLQNNFTFFGNSKNLKAEYHNFDYLILPTYMECFNLSILESLAANVFVITTPVGGNIEVIVDGVNGYLFDTKNIVQLKVCIEEILNGIRFLNTPTRPFVEENFSLNKMVENHFNLLQ